MDHRGTSTKGGAENKTGKGVSPWDFPLIFNYENISRHFLGTKIKLIRLFLRKSKRRWKEEEIMTSREDVATRSKDLPSPPPGGLATPKCGYNTSEHTSTVSRNECPEFVFWLFFFISEKGRQR